MVKGAGLKLRCLVLHGFESHPLHHQFIRPGFTLPIEHPNLPSNPVGDSLVRQTTPATAFSGSKISSSIEAAKFSNRECLFEIADSIPLQISSVEGNAEIANELILVVEQKIEESEGLNLELWNENLERAKNAIEKGDYNLGRGLAESILRDLEKERESMDYIRKALNKKSKTKSMSDTVSIEFFVGLLKPNFLEV